MIFNSFNFIVLFPFIFLLYYAIPARYGKGRNLFLLLVSYLLYLQWKPVYALILLGVTAVTWAAALVVNQSRRPKWVLTAGVLLGLLPLAFFKYFNFINESVKDVLSIVGLDFHLAGLNWAIPIGISFFTFQALGYLWDVYYKRQEPERDFLTYALFVSFFPSILSGPINKASLVIPQLKQCRPYFDYDKAVGGLKLLLWGMFMKVVVADRVALYVDTILPNYEHWHVVSGGKSAVYHSNLCRLCRLFANGYWRWQGAWLRVDGELPSSIFCRQCHRLLASLAYLALHMAEGLCVYSVGR